MANLHAIGGVSFKKGCYPGQEVVARMQYLGKLKRRMFHAHVATEQIPCAGDNLYSSGSDDAVGKIVQAQATPQGGIELLAVLQIAQAEQYPIHLENKNGPQLEFIELPYEVPLEREK
jgi:folate-binding Fe-S cluster repair protein YgfZ